MSADILKRLTQHLERLPGGFARCDDGAHLRLLAMLFEPEEAELALCLTMQAASPAEIARRAGRPVALVAAMLQEMAHKGTVITVEDETGQIAYSAAPWNIGIADLQVSRLSAEWLDALDAYEASAQAIGPGGAIPQMRTIPIGESLTPDLHVLPYERVAELIDAQTSYAVADCYCRLAAEIRGQCCDAPKETCLTFGQWADHYIRTGRGRAISRNEVLSIIAQANERGLVLQPSNSQEITILCCCCGCCCGILKGLLRETRPAAKVANAFIAQLDHAACVGCGTCLSRCQMGALTDDGNVVALNADRCIGCGLCVSTCPSGALTLRRKEGEPPRRTPETFHEMQRLLAHRQTDA